MRKRNKTLSKLIAYLAQEKKSVFLLLGVIVAMVVCNVYAPDLQSRIINLITEGEYSAVTSALLVLLGTYGLYSAGLFLMGQVSAILSQRIVKRMRQDLFHKMVNLPVRYLDTHPHGDIMSRMTNDVESVSNAISQSLASIFQAVLTVTGTVLMMLYLCWQLALVSCITMSLTVIITKFIAKKSRSFYQKRQELLGELNSAVEETVSGYRTVTAYNRQKQTVKEFEQTADELTRTAIFAEGIGTALPPLMNMINNAGFVLIALCGGYFALTGLISVGYISGFIVYARQFGGPIRDIAQIYSQLQAAFAGAERVFALMDEECEDKSGGEKMPARVGSISFRNVNFSYREGHPVLRNFNLEVKAGQKVALVGATGSGKTTVTNLLERFYPIDSGEILINGINIRVIDCDELRKSTTIILQDTVLFTDTVGNNLKYANQSATDEEMAQAARDSYCEGMIRQMPDGYDTLLAEGGQNLSQGQRQLLSIGRAFLACPQILILDEATSNIDTRTEKEIQNAMFELMKNRTSLIIAHRLSTIRDADLIVVMDQGSVVETGNHEELLKKQGTYYRLYMTQFAGIAT